MDQRLKTAKSQDILKWRKWFKSKNQIKVHRAINLWTYLTKYSIKPSRASFSSHCSIFPHTTLVPSQPSPTITGIQRLPDNPRPQEWTISMHNILPMPNSSLITKDSTCITLEKCINFLAIKSTVKPLFSSLFSS